MYGFIYIHTHMYACIYTHIRYAESAKVSMLTRIARDNVYAHIYICIHIYTHTHLRIYIYTHISQRSKMQRVQRRRC